MKGERRGLSRAPEAPIAIEKIANKVQEDYKVQSDALDKVTKNLLKEASVMADKRTVDAVLSLKMISKGNIMEYVALVPEFEKIMSELANMLLTSRLGINQIEPSAVKTAMLAIADVVAVLKKLGTTVKEIK